MPPGTGDVTEVPPHPDKVIHYPFFRKLLESQGYVFQKYDKPMDIWKDKYGNEIHLCEPCRILVINGKRVHVGIPSGLSYSLIKFLFNTEPNGHKESNRDPG